jgi:hypothetical protein
MGMDLTDEEISNALQQALATPEQLVQLLAHEGIEPTADDAVGDVRRLADAWGLDVETVLYGLTSEDSPLFADEEFWSE